jgi:hypothetical protein
MKLFTDVINSVPKKASAFVKASQKWVSITKGTRLLDHSRKKYYDTGPYSQSHKSFGSIFTHFL